MSDPWINECAGCHGRLINPAQIDDVWYCHRDGDEPSCYTKAAYVAPALQDIKEGRSTIHRSAFEFLGSLGRPFDLPFDLPETWGHPGWSENLERTGLRVREPLPTHLDSKGPPVSLYDRLVPAEALSWGVLTQTHLWAYRDDWGWVIGNRATVMDAIEHPRFDTPWLPWRKRR